MYGDGGAICIKGLVTGSSLTLCDLIFSGCSVGSGGARSNTAPESHAGGGIYLEVTGVPSTTFEVRNVIQGKTGNTAQYGEILCAYMATDLDTLKESVIGDTNVWTLVTEGVLTVKAFVLITDDADDDGHSFDLSEVTKIYNIGGSTSTDDSCNGETRVCKSLSGLMTAIEDDGVTY